MTKYREILRLYSQGISQRSIASSCQCSRNTVAMVISRANQHELSWPISQETTDANLQDLLFPEKNISSNRRIPDCSLVHKEMSKSGVTLSLLWSEYCETCRLNNEIPLMYSQFCRYYHKFANTTKATMHIHRKPGEMLEVDWAGKKASIIDNTTGEIINAYVFVASLSCSQYAYVEAFLSMNMESWITAHINAFKFFGGATRILIPDNLKTGVDRVDWYTPTINRTYHEMAEHYETAVIPARVRKPKDKPTAEGTVGIISTWIIAALRNQQFFSLRELNQAIFLKLDEFNQKPFQKKEGCRLSIFLEEEKYALLPLPITPYELATWKIATVQYDYCITVEKMHYSVPYEYIKHKVDVRITRNIVEIFFNNHRIASHVRLYGQEGQFSRIIDHMPDNHKQFVTWDEEYFLSWSSGAGENISAAVKSLLSSGRVKQQGFKSCISLIKLADKHSLPRLEKACEKALSYTPNPSLKSIQMILKTKQDKAPKEERKTHANTNDSAKFGFTRGADYYGGKQND